MRLFWMTPDAPSLSVQRAGCDTRHEGSSGGGIGYCRGLKLPRMEQLLSFPVSQINRQAKAARSETNGMMSYDADQVEVCQRIP
jgi:hypothetical protein